MTLRVEGNQLIELAPVRSLVRPSAYGRWGKRPLDVVLASALIVVSLPVLVAVALSIPVMLGRGGILYRQARVGRHGQVFTIYKFRSMLQDRRGGATPRRYRGPERRRIHKSGDDPRHTPYGRFLRSTSLDELPQVFNILLGHMSLVGPRPELVAVAEREGFVDHPRHLVRPGLTGPFQVSPLRSANRISDGLHLDLAYVVDVRFRRDLALLARTVRIVLARGGS